MNDTTNTNGQTVAVDGLRNEKVEITSTTATVKGDSIGGAFTQGEAEIGAEAVKQDPTVQ